MKQPFSEEAVLNFPAGSGRPRFKLAALIPKFRMGGGVCLSMTAFPLAFRKISAILEKAI